MYDLLFLIQNSSWSVALVFWLLYYTFIDYDGGTLDIYHIIFDEVEVDEVLFSYGFSERAAGPTHPRHALLEC